MKNAADALVLRSSCRSLRICANNSDISIPFGQVISITFHVGHIGSRETHSQIIRTFNPASGLGSQVPCLCSQIAKNAVIVWSDKTFLWSPAAETNIIRGDLSCDLFGLRNAIHDAPFWAFSWALAVRAARTRGESCIRSAHCFIKSCYAELVDYKGRSV